MIHILEKINKGGYMKKKKLIDKKIQEGIDDVKKGLVHGPFDSVDKMINSLYKNTNKLKTKLS